MERDLCAQRTRTGCLGRWPEDTSRGGQGAITRRWAPLILLTAVGMGLFLSACAPAKKVLVDIQYPPPIAFRGMKVIDIQEIQGPADCAESMKHELVRRATDSKDYEIAIMGMSDPSETVTIKGTVTTCSINLGSGALHAVFSAWLMGNQVHQSVINEQTNRPGASSNEVRKVLIGRVLDRFADKILTRKKREVRIFRPVEEDQDIGVAAASNEKWGSAIESFGKQLKSQPTEHRAWYNRGIAYEANGQLKLSVKDLEKAVELGRCKLYVDALARVKGYLESQTVIETRKRNAE